MGGVAVVGGDAGWRKERRTLRLLLLLLLLEEIKGVTRETNTRTTPNINPCFSRKSKGVTRENKHKNKLQTSTINHQAEV